VIGIEPGEAFGPCARNAPVVFDDGRAFVLGIAPCRERSIERRNWRRGTSDLRLGST